MNIKPSVALGYCLVSSLWRSVPPTLNDLAKKTPPNILVVDSEIKINKRTKFRTISVDDLLQESGYF